MFREDVRSWLSIEYDTEIWLQLPIFFMRFQKVDAIMNTKYEILDRGIEVLIYTKLKTNSF